MSYVLAIHIPLPPSLSSTSLANRCNSGIIMSCGRVKHVSRTTVVLVYQAATMQFDNLPTRKHTVRVHPWFAPSRDHAHAAHQEAAGPSCTFATPRDKGKMFETGACLTLGLGILVYVRQRLLHIRPQPCKRATHNGPHTAFYSKPLGLGRCFWNGCRHGIIVTMTPSTTTTISRLQLVPFCVDAVSALRHDRLIWHEDYAKHITVHLPRRVTRTQLFETGACLTFGQFTFCCSPPALAVHL